MTAVVTLNPARTRRCLERGFGGGWSQPTSFGPAGFILDHNPSRTRVVVTQGPAGDDDTEWTHASISHPHHDPTYAELVLLHRAVFDDTWAYQVFAPRAAHVNIHAHALHLWGLADGSPALPNFGRNGSI